MPRTGDNLDYVQVRPIIADIRDKGLELWGDVMSDKRPDDLNNFTSKSRAMEHCKVISLADHKARRIDRAKRISQIAVEKTLPDLNHLYKLLDRNISLSVWEKGVK